MIGSADLFLEYKKRPEPALLARLLERHQEAVYSLCHRVLRHPQDAEDACQEVLLEVSRQVDAIEEPGSFAGWLYRTALHTALDLKRKRGRQRVREAGARRPLEAVSPEESEALVHGLAGLDETSRMLVVEHYFAARPLRELAEERGCSEAAVWKRIQNARERLRKLLGSAAVSALEGMVRVQAPAGFLRYALGIQGGLAMATKAGIKLAIVAPLVLLAAAGTVVYVRQPDPPPPSKITRKPPPAGSMPIPAASPSSALSVPPRRLESETTAKSPPGGPRRPYPLKLPAPGYSAAAMNTWSILTSKRIALDFSSVSLPTVLKDIGEKVGILILVEPGHDRDLISMKVQLLEADSCLRLMLGPREFDYEIRDDGSVFVASKKNIQGGYERAARERINLSADLKRVRADLDAGWDGIRPSSDEKAAAESVLRTRRITTAQGESTMERELLRLREDFKLEVYVDDPVDAEGFERQQAALNQPFVQVVGEQTVGAYVDRLARQLQLTAVLMEHGAVFLANEKRAAQYRAQEDQKKRVHDRMIEDLEKPLEGTGAATVQDFLDSVSRSHQLKIVPSEEAWESDAPVSLPQGATLRESLDQLKSQDFRWAVREGKLFLLKGSALRPAVPRPSR